jgi:PAS domain S-box-containing protein
MFLEFMMYISFLLSSLFLISRYITNKRNPLSYASPLTDKLMYGFFYGVIGLGIMYIHQALDGSGYADPRQVTILLPFFYGGWIPALVSSLLIFVVRFTIFNADGVNVPILLLSIGCTLAIAQILIMSKIDRSKQWYLIAIASMLEIYFFLWFRDRQASFFDPDLLRFAVSFIAGSILSYHFTEALRQSHQVLLELKQSKTELEKSEANYRLIAENSSDLIAVLDSETKAIYLSPSHTSVLGLKTEMCLGKEVSVCVHPDDYHLINKPWAVCLQEKRAFLAEYRFRHALGHWVWVESQFVPVLEETGNIEKIVVISRDITERKETEEVIRNTEKLSVVGELAAGIAHEIRNPLTTLKGFIQVMKQDSTSLQPYFFDIMYEELNRIDLITNELLYLAKPQVQEIGEIPVQKTLDQIITLLHPQAVLQNIILTLRLEYSLPTIIGMENRLKQVFINLLKNAMEAMPTGGEIIVEAKREDESTLYISVKDQGTGIPEDRLDKLGQPFYTLKEKGTGLGLTVCKKIIQEHNGSMTFQSEVGAGTTVIVRLPLLHSNSA